MNKPLLLLLFFCLVFTARAQSDLFTSVAGTSFCADSATAITVSYSDAVTTYLPGNIFSVQLSDDQGSFASPVVVGELISTASSGMLQALLPPVSGNGYRVRVVASNPAVIGNDNGADLQLEAPLQLQVSAGGSTFLCPGGSVSLSASGSNSYNWSPAAGLSSSTGAVVTASPTTSTTYTVTGSGSAVCPAATATIAVYIDTVSALLFETMGPWPVLGSQTVNMHEASNSFDNNQLLFSGTPATTVRSINPSNNIAAGGIITASGGNSILLNFNSAINTYEFVISDINTLGMNNLMLTYLLRKQAPTSDGTELVVEYSVDGGLTYVALTVPPLTGSQVGSGSNNKWYEMGPVAGIPQVANLTLRWRQTSTNMQFQLDDILLTNGGSAPTITASGGTDFCQGDITYLTASSGSSYSWNTGDTTQVIEVTQAGTYTVNVGGNSCILTAPSHTVTSTSAPLTPVVFSNSPVCTGQVLTLSASGPAAATYSWTGPDGAIYTGQTVSIPSASAANNGVFSVTATMAGCSSGSAIDTVTVSTDSAPMAAVLSTNSPVCAGDSLRLFAAGNWPAGTLFNWSFVGANGTPFSSSLQNPVRANASVSYSGTYTFTATHNGCSTTPAMVNVQVNTLPFLPTVYTNSPLCEGQAIQFTGVSNAGNSYSWINPQGVQFSADQFPVIQNATPAHNGVYTLFVTDGNGCASSPAYVTIIVNEMPVADATSNSPVCEGETLLLNTPPVPGAVYSWSGPSSTDPFSSTLRNPTRQNVMLDFAGTYHVWVTLNGCTTEDTVQVEINPGGAIAIDYPSPVCAGSDLALTASSNSAQPYSWSGPNGFTGTGSVVTVPNMAAAAYGTYLVTSAGSICDYNGTVHINPPAAPIINGTSVFCDGGAITLTIDTLAGATGYSWTGPDNFTSTQTTININNATAANAGTYSVITDYGVCTSAASTFAVNNIAGGVISAGPPVTLNEGATLFLSASGTAGVYSWTGPNNFTATGTNPFIQGVTPAHSGDYSVSLQVPGCAQTTAVTNVQVIGQSLITGVLYTDLNNDGVQNPGELPLVGKMVKLQPGNLWSITNIQGQYKFFVMPGTYTVSHTGAQNFTVISPANHTVTVAGSQQVISDLNFALYVPPVTDAKVGIYSIEPPRPGFLYSATVYCQNLGNQPLSGEIKFVPDPILAGNMPVISSGYTMSGDTVVWAYNNLYASSYILKTYEVYIPATTPLNTVLTSYAVVTPLATDDNTANNYATKQEVVVSSLDPNDKQVSPVGDISPAQVASQQDLTYKIRFQNTGTYHAEFVLLVDTISENLDLGSFRMLSASHNYQLSIRDGRVLEWYFPNIMLPDSNTNEPESHGYVQYQIKPVSSLQIGDEIENTAYIYFDFNEAVITNTTSTMINLVSAPEGLQSSNTMLLYPNPNNGSFTIELEDCKPGIINIKLTNLLGQEVFAEAASAKNNAFTHQLNLPHLPEGVYLLQVMQGEKLMVKRVVKQK